MMLIVYSPITTRWTFRMGNGSAFPRPTTWAKVRSDDLPLFLDSTIDGPLQFIALSSYGFYE